MTGLSHLFHDNYTGSYINHSDILQGNKYWAACDLKDKSVYHAFIIRSCAAKQIDLIRQILFYPTKKLGLLINFGSELIHDGISRVVNGL